MKELRDPRAVRKLLRDIEDRSRRLPRPPRIMEVCGTHTMALYRNGLTPLLADSGVTMVSGPGCPVCITPAAVHEAAIEIVTGRTATTLATFGDMTRVPTGRGSLREAVPAPGSRTRIVYSPEEALEEARGDAKRTVVFFAAGFETTIPSIAYIVRRAAEEGLENFSVLTALWLIPPALRALLEAGDASVDGFIYPGHVSAVIGSSPYEFVAQDFHVPGAVAGFEPGDILLAIRSVLDQALAGEPRVALEYSRAVRPEGNPVALALMEEVLEPYDATWRGLGLIPRSGLRLRSRFSAFDAWRALGGRASGPVGDLPGCRCGEVLRGVVGPEDCRLFGTKCQPDSPVGPCMVSYEGACFIHFKYGRRERAGR